MDEEWFDRVIVDEITAAVQELLEEFDGRVEKQIALREVRCSE
jgi:hypothetical protein